MCSRQLCSQHPPPLSVHGGLCRQPQQLCGRMAACLVVFKTSLYSTPLTPTQCKAGYNGTGSNCTACATGTYKNFMGSGGCCYTPYRVACNARLDPPRRIKRVWPQVYQAPYIRSPPPSEHSAKTRSRNPKPEPRNPPTLTPNPKPQTHIFQTPQPKPQTPSPTPLVLNP